MSSQLRRTAARTTVKASMREAAASSETASIDPGVEITTFSVV
jgi:hypothetical protein